MNIKVPVWIPKELTLFKNYRELYFNGYSNKNCRKLESVSSPLYHHFNGCLRERNFGAGS